MGTMAHHAPLKPQSDKFCYEDGDLRIVKIVPPKPLPVMSTIRLDHPADTFNPWPTTKS